MIRELCLVYKILKWADKTFPNATELDQKQKLAEEIREYNTAMKNYIKSPYPRRPKYSKAVNDEMTDVIIASINWPTKKFRKHS